jgi:glucose-6-phosphate dehydrogenase assembly protein OpcA
MAGAVASRTWRRTEPEHIEADLAALWRDAGAGETRIARAVMSNLVVFRDRVASADAEPSAIVEGLPLDEVAARHPSRLIVLEHCYDAAAGAPFSAGVGITTFGPAQARYGVEQIAVRSACPDQALLSILRRFVRGDLPTTVWWTEDLSAAAALEPFVEVGRQLLYDSRQWRDVARGAAAVVAVAADERIDPADLNWRRLAPLRRALVEVRGPLASWSRGTVRVVPAPGEEALAWLCAGWLRAARQRADIETSASTSAERLGDERRTDGSARTLLTVRVDNLTATLTPRAAVVEGLAPPLVVAAPVESDAALRALAHAR